MKPDKNKRGGPSKDHSSQQQKNVSKESTEKATKPADEEQAGPSKSYSRRKIVSNWDKYEEPISSITYNEVYEPEGDDFNKLLQMPSSADSHFKFKSEELEPPPYGNLFALNLKSLASGLATIPFYELVDIPSTTFAETEIEKMNNEAELMKLQWTSS